MFHLKSYHSILFVSDDLYSYRFQTLDYVHLPRLEIPRRFERWVFLILQINLLAPKFYI